MSLHRLKKMPRIALNTFCATKSVYFAVCCTRYTCGYSFADSSTWTKQYLKWLEGAFILLWDSWIINFKSVNQFKVQIGLPMTSIIYIKPLISTKAKTLSALLAQ